MKLKYIYFAIIISAVSFSACFKDLDTVPTDPDVSTSEQVYQDPDAYKQVLAKLYAGLAVSGQQGPAGNSDIDGIDEGFGQYLRGLWYHQEFTTDEALVGWNDQTIKDFHNQTWTPTDGFTFAFYSRVFYQIPLCNEFLRETTTEKLSGREQSDLQAEVDAYRTEARYLRALSYWHAIDIFRNVPFVTEEDGVGSFFPEQIAGSDLFSYIESELLAIEDVIAPVRTNEYGRADQGAVWALLAKLYLNAEVYTGTARWNDCLAYCEKLINGGYSLEPSYQNLFLADNHLSDEIIFPIAFDGVNTRTWGGMTFIIRAAIGGTMNSLDSGVSGGWGGVRTTRQLVEKFGELGGSIAMAQEGNTVTYGQVYVPGSYQGEPVIGPESSLTSAGGDNIFEGYKYFPSAGGDFVVRTIPSLNGPFLGDNDGDGILDNGGANIVVEEAGLHLIRIDLNDNSYVVEKTDWSISGDIVDGVEGAMEWDADNQAMVATVVVTEGTIDFVSSTGQRLGDDTADGILEYGGSDIAVPAGEYIFLLYLGRPDYTYAINSASFDTRAHFYSDGQTLDIEDVTQFTNGYAVNKFKNVTSDGALGSDTDFPDTDFPVFRLADFYLMAAEAIMRAGGDKQQATDYFNEVRTRAYGSAGGNVSADELDLELLLDERARELYWECHRRTDLVRFGQFSDGDYLWQWKGGVKEGAQVEPHRDIFPIPSSDIAANLNLVQNPGY